MSAIGSSTSEVGTVSDLSAKSDNPPVEPEVRVDVKDNGQWVRIPVTSCELWINKDGPADITRTAKVKFPAEWGGHDISQYINGFSSPSITQQSDPQFVGEIDETQPYDECRIWFYDHGLDDYQIAQYGYVGGVGPTEETRGMKFWVYDPADLMRGIQVSKSFGEPTIQQVVEFVLRGTDDNGRPVGLEHRSVFDNIQTYIGGPQPVRRAKINYQREPISAEDLDSEFSIDGELPIVGAFQLNVDDLVEDVYEFFTDDVLSDTLLSGQKRFQLNRNNMVDLLDWFAAEVGGKWHFEPTPDGPLLFVDNTSGVGTDIGDGEITRRFFVDNELKDAPQEWDVSAFKNLEQFDSVDVLNNDALYDVKPFNTLHLYGEGQANVLRNRDDWETAASPSEWTTEFPYVKVTYPPLVKRAGGYEYSAPTVESDKMYLPQAEQQAVKEFRKHLSEATEGSIEIRGEPHILPFDYIRTIPTCNDTYENANAVPITYEVNSVRHVRSAEQPYTTELGVSLVFDESKLEIESEYRES